MATPRSAACTTVTLEQDAVAVEPARLGVIISNHNESVVSLPETAPTSELWLGVRIGNHNETIVQAPARNP